MPCFRHDMPLLPLRHADAADYAADGTASATLAVALR